jgi:hypothetical protein
MSLSQFSSPPAGKQETEKCTSVILPLTKAWKEAKGGMEKKEMKRYKKRKKCWNFCCVLSACGVCPLWDIGRRNFSHDGPPVKAVKADHALRFTEICVPWPVVHWSQRILLERSTTWKRSYFRNCRAHWIHCFKSPWGSTIAQTFSRRLPTAAARVRSQVRSYGDCGEQIST